MVRKYFGTDGIRGRVGKPPITPEFILKLGWAVGRVLREHNSDQCHVIIGKDTRISGYLFESALEAGLSAAGVNISLVGPMPTPAIAYLTRTFRADIGIVISASHNLYFDNGIKFFSRHGVKIPDDWELAIERKLDEPLLMVDSALLGKANRIEDAAGRYIEFCKSTFPNHISLHGLKIVLDCANGATYHVAPHVFEELGADVIAMNKKPDGFNINQECGSVYPELLRERVLLEEADLGIALDGDGDRVMMIDHRGNIVDGDHLLYIIAMQAKADGMLKGGVVGTEMSNLALEKALAKEDIAFTRSKVGDRYVIEELKKQGWSFGAEPSGHIVCLNHTSTGDGIVSALQVLAAVVKQNRSLHELAQVWHKMPQTLINVPCESAKAVLAHAQTQELLHQMMAELGDRGRWVVRASGTEPLIRVMVEGEDHQEIQKLAEKFAKAIMK